MNKKKEGNMNKFKIGASSAVFGMAILLRMLLTHAFQPPLPFPIDIVDAFIVISGALLAVLSAHEYILKRYRDTADMLPLFCGIVWTVIISGYVILRYYGTYQTSLSILVTGTFVGMGWWIQAINTAANARRAHTLNIIMASRTSTEYQQQTRASSRLYRGDRIIPQELAEWRWNPSKDEFKNAVVPKKLDEAISGTVYILNYFEFLSQGIKHKDLDDKLLKECFSGILKGIEKRGFHLIVEAQKSEPESFEGVVRLAKEWNQESTVEKYRSTPENAAIGTCSPSGPELEKILRGKHDKPKPPAPSTNPAATHATPPATPALVVPINPDT